MIHFTPNAVAHKAYENYNPDHFDFIFHGDGSLTIIPVLWWDDASYIAYQAGLVGYNIDAERDFEEAMAAEGGPAGVIWAAQAMGEPDYEPDTKEAYDELPF